MAVTGDGDVVEHWQDAVRGFHEAGLAHDEAQARLRLAAALRGAGDDAAAQEQEQVAAAVLARVRGPGPSAPTARGSPDVRGRCSGSSPGG